MTLAVYDRHATGEACFGFILSFSVLHFCLLLPFTLRNIHLEHHVMAFKKNLVNVCLEMCAEVAGNNDDYKYFCEQFEQTVGRVCSTNEEGGH